jgi:hypothetical protein
MEFKPICVADALRQGTPIDMLAKCHNVHWPATDIERGLLGQRIGRDGRLGRPEPDDNNSDPPFGFLGSNRPES